MSMLRLAPDASTVEHKLDELYPGGSFEVVEWEKCIQCDRDVDGYIYVAGMRRGYCSDHFMRVPYHAE